MKNEETGTKKRMRGGAAALLLAVFCALISITGCDLFGGHSASPEPEPIDYSVKKTGITVLSPPDITYYGRNQTFSTAGLKVGWVYSDGSTGEMPVGEYTVVTTPDMADYSPKQIKIRAGDFETSFNIRVVDTDKTLMSITASVPANKPQALGKDFDKKGLVVTGHFSDGSRETVTPYAAISGYDKFKRGPQSVTVKMNGKTAALSGIETRISDDANVSIDTGYGVNTTFIKGEALTPAKTGLRVFFNLTNLLANRRELSLANGGLTEADFTGLIAAYKPNQTGAQSLPLNLDGRSFSLNVYVVDAEPDVWFDFGYMRHAGDPTGHGPGAGEFYARLGETLVIAPVRYLIGYNADHSDAGVSYSWSTGGVPYTTSSGGELLHVTPSAAGTYTINVSVTGKSYIDGATITRTASAPLVCYTGSLSAGTFTSPLRNFGPGQMCQGGTGYGWSLGSAGGYEVWEVNHQASYSIVGNPLTTWLEPGVVWFQEDKNGNGLPDEMWYELPGSDDQSAKWRPLITRRYAVSYYKSADHGSKNEYGQLIRKVFWADSRGRAGMIPGGFPVPWGVVGDKVTYTTTLLRDDGAIFAAGYNMTGLSGYVDTPTTTFSVSGAVKADGSPAGLTSVRFIKVQTGMFRYGDIFGDVSTEIRQADGLGITTDFPLP